MKKILLVILSFFICFLASAQHNFKPGYIISLNNDSINGEIDYKRKAKNNEICLFRKSRKDSVIKYSPYHIKAYGIENCNLYISRVVQIDSLNTSRVFLETLIKGRINIYSYYSSGKSHYYIERQYFDFIEIPYKEYIKTVNGVEKVYKTNLHKEVLKQYMVDCPAIDKQIFKIYEPEETPLIKLVRKYHLLTDSNERNIVFRKKISHTNLSILPSYKYQSIQKSHPGDHSNNYFGFMFMVGNNLNERLFAKTGLLITKINHTDSAKTTVYQIPWRINYLYPKYNIKPYIGIGINTNFYVETYYIQGVKKKSFSKGNDFSLELGIIYDINSKFGLFTDFGIDFSTPDGSIVFVYSNEVYKKYNFQVGLNIKLF